MNKAQWIAVILAVIFLAALGAFGYWHICKTNERLLALQEQAEGADWVRSEPTPKPSPSPKPPKTADFEIVNPNDFVTRAMFTAMLAELDSADLSGYSSPRFDDVTADKWYAPAVSWAADTGLVTGIGNGNFAPESSISREQLAVVLNNYLQFKDYTITAEVAPDSTDREEISTWALDSVDVIRALGIIPDRQNQKYAPQGKVTNNEADAIFEQLMGVLQDTPIEYPGASDLDETGNWLPPYETPDSSPLPVYRDETLIIPKS